jgi:hypothetical protein
MNDVRLEVGNTEALMAALRALDFRDVWVVDSEGTVGAWHRVYGFVAIGGGLCNVDARHVGVVDQIKRQYSVECVGIAAKRYGWKVTNVRETAGGSRRFVVQKR